MLEGEVNRHPHARGFIFDGFPRTEPQALALEAFLARRGEAVTAMVALEVPEEELRARLLKRAETSGRVDDADPAVIQKRIDVYNRETAPVADFYRAKSKYRGVDGVGTLEQITERLVQAIG
jgi:adenylate kinase